jgi:glycosyltransferase involved in cell wall biosynthesis
MIEIADDIFSIQPKIDVVIPTFNSKNWLNDCINSVRIALEFAGVSNYNVIVVDDGSTDGTADQIERQAIPHVRVLRQSNFGRLLAREHGATASKARFCLFIDSRVRLDRDSVAHVISRLNQPQTQIWTCDVKVVLEHNPLARFWYVIERVFWNDYYKNPREAAIVEANFDYFPKGTGGLLIPREIFLSASRKIRESHRLRNPKKVNDDTAILRLISRDHPIMISPLYSCTYHARSSVNAFLRHANHRGSVLIDGHWRPGARLRHPITFTLVGFPSIIAVSLIVPLAAFTLVIAGQLFVFAEVTRRRFGLRNAAVFSLAFPFFSISYFTGMLYGIWLRHKEH